MNIWVVISMISGIISIVAAVFYYRWVVKQDPGTERAQRVARWIEEGSQSYLKKLYVALTGLSRKVMAVVCWLSCSGFRSMRAMGCRSYLLYLRRGGPPLLPGIWACLLL